MKAFICLVAILFGIQIIEGIQNFLTPVNTALDECLPPILQYAAKSIHFICEPNSTTCPGNLIGSSWPRTSFNENSGMSFDLRRDDICAISAEDDYKTYALFQKFRKCHRANIVLTFFGALDPHVFEKYWKIGIINVVIVTADSSDCNVYSYLPFQSHRECGDTTPVLLGSWKKYETRNLSTITYFPENKISNMYSCIFFMIYPDGYNTASYWAPLIAFIEVAMNSSILTISEEDIDKYDLLGIVYLKYAVVALRSLTPDLLKENFVPFYSENMDVVLAVPSRPTSSVQWFRLLNELSPIVWYTLLVSFGVSVITFYVLLKNETLDFGYIVFFTVRPLLSVPCPPRTFPWHARTYFASWMIFSFMLNSIYLCTILSKLTVPFHEDAINTIHDLTKSDLVIHCPVSSKDMVDTYISPDSLYAPIKNKIVYVNKTYWTVIDESRDDVAYIINKDDFDVYFANMPYRILPDKAIYRTVVTPMQLPRLLPYGRIFERAVLRAAGAGAFVYIERHTSFKKVLFKIKFGSREKNGALPLSFKSLSAIFGLWFGGCSCGLVIFVTEICISWIRCVKSG